MPAARTATPARLTWALLVVVVVAAGAGLDRAGLPSSYLFAALLASLILALARPAAIDVPPWTFRAAQAVAGVTLGAYLETSTLRELGAAWLPVTLICAATLALSLGAGLLLARTTPLDGPTAALGLIAGGASGIVGMSGELGADRRLVAFMQTAGPADRSGVLTGGARSAVPARPVEHDLVLGHVEGDAVGDAVDCALQLVVLERDDLLACVADEVVVMVAAAGVDGLVAGDAVADLDPRDELELLELVDDAVDAGPRDRPPAAGSQRLLDLERRQRAGLAGEQVDHCPPGTAAAVAGVGQAL